MDVDSEDSNSSVILPGSQDGQMMELGDMDFEEMEEMKKKQLEVSERERLEMERKKVEDEEKRIEDARLRAEETRIEDERVDRILAGLEVPQEDDYHVIAATYGLNEVSHRSLNFISY